MANKSHQKNLKQETTHLRPGKEPEAAAESELEKPVTAPGVPKPDARNSIDPVIESTVESFAWETVKRVRRLAELSKQHPEQARKVARQILKWPVMSSIPCSDEDDPAWHPAFHLELGRDYPLITHRRSRLHSGSEMGLYLTRWIIRLHEFRLSISFRQQEPSGQAPSDEELIRHHWRKENEPEPGPDIVAVLREGLKLPLLTRATSHEWSKGLLVPVILLTDAGTDEATCREPALRAIWRQRGVKSIATFKSRLLSMVCQMVRDRVRVA